MPPKKPTTPKLSPARPTNSLAAPKPKVQPKPKAPAPVAPPTRFTQDGKPDPNGLYDRDGYMVEVPGKRNKFPKGEKERADTAAAKRLGYTK